MPGFAGPAIQWWDGRTARERRLLLAMCVLLALAAVWLAVVRPALDWREAAADRRHRAATTATAIRGDLARLPSQARPANASPSGGMEPLVRRTAGTAGLDPVLSMHPDGGLGFQLASAHSGTALAWLAALEVDQGLRLCQLSVVENADATVNVEGRLAAGTCGAGRAEGRERS